MHRVNLLLTLSFPPVIQEKEGKKRWAFQLCPKPRAGGGGKGTAETQRTLPPLQGRGRFPGWSNGPSVLAHLGRGTDSSLGCEKDPTF